MAKLLMDSLVTKMTRKALQEAIGELPKTLHETYDDALSRINKQNEDEKELAERILSWISYSFRPLNIMELRHALAVTPGEEYFDEANMPDEEDLPSVCAGLIYIEEGSKMVRLAHYTAQDYLESIRDQSFVDARRLVAATCLTYLTYEGNRLCCNGLHYVYRFGRNGYSLDRVGGLMRCPYASRVFSASETAKDAMDGDQENFYHTKNGTPLALYQYAAHYWARHIKDRLEKDLEPLAMKFILDDTNRQMALGVLRRLWWTTRIKGPLTVVVQYDLRHICHILLQQQSYNLEDEEGEGYRSLLSAAELGRDQVIKMLLHQSNLPSLIDDHQWFVLTPLSWVAWTGNRAAVLFLLQSAGVISADGSTRESGRYSLYKSQILPENHDPLIEGLESLGIPATIPLIAVLSNVSTLQTALATPGADIETRDPTHKKTALHHASQSGRTGIVELLLSRGADVRARDFYGETPLHYAVDSGNLEVVKLLVEAGSDLDAKNDNGEVPTEILRIWAGSDLNARNDNGEVLTGMFRTRVGDIPCPIHQDELWEETHEYLFREVMRREGKEMQLRQMERREVRKKYGASWREFHNEAGLE